MSGLSEGHERGRWVARAPQHEAELEPEHGVARQEAQPHHRLGQLTPLQKAVHDHSVRIGQTKLGVPVHNERGRGEGKGRVGESYKAKQK